MDIEIKCQDKEIFKDILQIAEDCGGEILYRNDNIMGGSCNVKIPIENCNRTIFEQILNTKIGVIKI